MLACTSRLAAFQNAETSQKCTGQERCPAQHFDNKTDIGLCTCASTALTLQHANTTYARLVYSGQDTEQNQRCRCVHTRGKCQTAAVSLYLHAVQCVHTGTDATSPTYPERHIMSLSAMRRQVTGRVSAQGHHFAGSLSADWAAHSTLYVH